MRHLCFVILLLVASGLEWFEEGSPFMLLGANFNKTLKEDTHCKFVKFFTPWCRFCRVLKTIIDEHRQITYQNRTDVRFYEVNCHQSPDICMPLEVYSVPYIMFFDRNGEKKQTAAGVYPKEWYVEMINSNCFENPEQNPLESKKSESSQTTQSQASEARQQENPDANDETKRATGPQKGGSGQMGERTNTSQDQISKQQNISPISVKNLKQHNQSINNTPNIPEFPQDPGDKEQLKKETENGNLAAQEWDGGSIEEDFLTKPMGIEKRYQKDELGFKGEDLKILTIVVIVFGVCWVLHNKFYKKNERGSI